MSKKTFSQKIRKKNERAKNREKRITTTRAALMAENHEKLAGYIEPDDDTVIFKGLSTKILDELKTTVTSNDYSFTALQNFYTEFKNEKGKTVKVRYMKPMAPYSPSDLLILMKDIYKARNQYSNEASVDTLEMLKKCDEDSFLATFFIEYDDEITMGYIMTDHEGAIQGIIVDTADVVKSVEAETIATNKYKRSQKEQDRIELSKIHAKNALFEAMCILGLYAIYSVQYIICCYLKGEKLPKLDIPEPNSDPTSKTSRPSRTPSAQKDPAGKDPNNCVAYIYYDAKDGSVTIGGNRNYSMRWWIVRGHQRHLQSGDVVQVTPYIKGDREDPDAQKALREILSGIERIKYYQLIARRVLESK